MYPTYYACWIYASLNYMDSRQFRGASLSISDEVLAPAHPAAFTQAGVTNPDITFSPAILMQNVMGNYSSLFHSNKLPRRPSAPE